MKVIKVLVGARSIILLVVVGGIIYVYGPALWHAQISVSALLIFGVGVVCGSATTGIAVLLAQVVSWKILTRLLDKMNYTQSPPFTPPAVIPSLPRLQDGFKGDDGSVVDVYAIQEEDLL